VGGWRVKGGLEAGSGYEAATGQILTATIPPPRHVFAPSRHSDSLAVVYVSSLPTGGLHSDTCVWSQAFPLW
jgi:hypothetical protein